MPHRVIKGIAVSPGVAVGPALVVRWEPPVVPDVTIRADQVARETRRLDEAMAYAGERIGRSRARAAERAGEEEARIFDAQLMGLHRLCCRRAAGLVRGMWRSSLARHGHGSCRLYPE